MSDTPRDPDDATANTGRLPAEDTIPEPDHGSSAFDEPTTRIPVAGTAQENPTTRIPTAGAQVLSTESDLPVGENPTQRIPTYEELSAPRREPQDVAASMDALLADEPKAKRGTLDTGLLLIRLVLGAILLAHGLQKLTGWWGGPGLDGFRTVLEQAHFEQAKFLSYATAITEVAAGGLLILGLATPLAAAAAVAVLMNAWAFVQSLTPGFQLLSTQNGGGVELETVLLIVAAGVLLAGPGRISLDGRRGWAVRPKWGSMAALLAGVLAGFSVWAILNGSNPFV